MENYYALHSNSPFSAYLSTSEYYFILTYIFHYFLRNSIILSYMTLSLLHPLKSAFQIQR